MTKHPEPNGKIEPNAGTSPRRPNSGASGFYVLDEPSEAQRDIPNGTGEWLVCKDNAERHGHIQLILESSSSKCGVKRVEKDAEHIWVLSFELEYPLTAEFRTHFRKQDIHEISLNACRLASDYKHLVLILDIKVVEFVDSVFAARVRLREFNLFRDIFRGELYMSAAKHRYFGLSVVDGKLDVLLAGHKRLHDLPVDMIQCTSDAMNGVPNDAGDMVWNGCVGFDREGQLARAWVEPSDQFERALLKVFPDTPIKIVDVMTRSV